MKQKRLLFCAIFLLFFGFRELQAQTTTTTTGGNSSGSSGSVSFSVGQIFYSTNTSSAGSISQGVQQPFDISIISGIENISISLTCNVYPNPTTDLIKLKVESDNHQEMIYQLFDLNGKRFDSKKIDNDETTISMEQYVASTYILKVMQNNREIKIFKIIKY